MVFRLHRPASKRVIPSTARRVNWRVAPWLLVLSLMAAQLLGTMHRITHAWPVGDDRGAVTFIAPPSTGDTDATGWLAALFAVHAANDAGCKLYDAHGQVGAPKVALLSLPVAGICFLGQIFESALLPGTHAAFEARAPPTFR